MVLFLSLFIAVWESESRRERSNTPRGKENYATRRWGWECLPLTSRTIKATFSALLCPVMEAVFWENLEC